MHAFCDTTIYRIKGNRHKDESETFDLYLLAIFLHYFDDASMQTRKSKNALVKVA